ncbi:MAG: hypothetical protein JXA96_05560 [Sedimentisphaerales bacterium]|nr:hypothetical protein [Sedimentisphaerales bacterium]
MKKKKYILFIIPVIIIITIVTLFIIAKKRSEFLFCSPSIPRRDSLSAWQETLISKPLTTELDNEFFDKIKVSIDANIISIEYPSLISQEVSFPFEMREMTHGQSLEIDGGILEVFGTGVAYCDANHVTNTKVPYQFFDCNLQPEKPEIIDELWQFQTYENDSQFRYRPFPFFQFGFRYKGIEDVMFNGIKVFDARTHKFITYGYSTTGHNLEDWDYLNYKINMPIWHQTPIDFVLDVSFGPSEVFEFPAQVGEGFTRGGFECRIMSIIEDIDTSSHSSSSDGEKTITKYYKSNLYNKGNLFIFACRPTANQMPVTFRFLDKDGQILSNSGGFSCSFFTQEVITKQPLEKIAKIQAQYLTNRYRVIVHLPYIPGLPEQNKNIKNLFDMHIPYVKLYDYNQINDFLRNVLQLNNSHTIGVIPSQNSQANTFPMVFKNVKVRDIAELYTIGGSVKADVENDTLEIKYPMPLLTKLKMLFLKMRNNDNE